MAASDQRFGVKVHWPRPFNSGELKFLSSLQVGAVQLFPADPILWIIGRHAIQLSLWVAVPKQGAISCCGSIIAPLWVAILEHGALLLVGQRPLGRPCWSVPGGRGHLHLRLCGRRAILVGIDERRSSSASGDWQRSRRYLLHDGYRVTGVPITGTAPIHLLAALWAAGPEPSIGPSRR